MRANFIFHYLGHFTLFFYQKIPDIWNLAWNNSKYLEFQQSSFAFSYFIIKRRQGNSQCLRRFLLSIRCPPVYIQGMHNLILLKFTNSLIKRNDILFLHKA